MTYINWNDTAPPPRRQRSGGGGRAVIIVVICALAIVAMVLRPWQHPALGATRQPAPSPTPPVTAAAVNFEGACVDPTSSLVPSFAPTMMRYLAQAVVGLGTSTPTPTVPEHTGAPLSAPRDGLSLTIRQVDTNSYSTIKNEFTLAVRVRPVPGLNQAQPDSTATDYNSQSAAWNAVHGRVEASRKGALSDAEASSQQIARLPLDDNPRNRSSITGCVSALLQTVRQSGHRSFLLASDLEDNMGPQLAGSFHRAPLVIIQACDNGDAAGCAATLNSFEKQMSKLHVGRITVVRPEDAAQAIAEWVRGKQVTV